MLFEKSKGGYVEIEIPINHALYTVFSEALQENAKGESYVPYDEFCSHINFAYDIGSVNQNSNLNMLDHIQEQLNDFYNPASSVCEFVLDENPLPTEVVPIVPKKINKPSLSSAQESTPVSNQHQKFYPPSYLSPHAPCYAPYPPVFYPPPVCYPHPVYYYPSYPQPRQEQQVESRPRVLFSGRGQAVAAQNQEIRLDDVVIIL